MDNIFTFLFHQIAGRLLKRVWRWDELQTASTLLNRRYRISKVHELGHDNPVYLAYDEVLKRDVAVKENSHHDQLYHRQFQLETTILANLDHPNIPKAFDHFIEEDRQYFVMDFIEGVNLQQLMQQRTAGTQEILGWAAQLCDILTYLHSLTPPIIHRDVQPSNIILASNGRLFLVDFGFAKIYRPEQEEVAEAKPGILRPAAAEHPETMFQKIHPITTDQRSDQYSLAATLYCLLTGAAPMDSMQRLRQKTELAPIRPSRPDLSAAAEEAIFRALSLHPDRRFRNIEDFKFALGAET